ncbi:unnamed protein product, partial [Mesorhabditis belari]|uniref:Glutamyl-tRNA(Gln) amidotransferase subunit C, mitochondrial n=1 Tax=Mesorhabditis belari TaxID=2138241 RepID=A0AAF3EQ20_9BILA
MINRFRCRCLLRTTIRKFARKTPIANDKLLVPDVPESSHVDDIGEVPSFDHKLITHLERLSLIRFSSEEAVANLRESIRIANRLKHIDVEGVQPMITVWDNMECPLRDDVLSCELERDEVLENAAETMEDYFVTPPGNIPLGAEKPLDLKLINEWDKLGQPNPPDPRGKLEVKTNKK